MAQQINLCTPILLQSKHYFSAHTMVLALGAFAVVGGSLCAAWVWNLQRATDGLQQVMQSQGRDIDRLKAAIQSSRAAAAPVDPALLRQLDGTRTAVKHHQQLLDALREGLLVPGAGHSDRLQWVARSIPAPVWISDLQMDPSRFEVSGYTLEPAALNAWVQTLATHPLMQGMQLATVRVEAAPTGGGTPPGGSPRAVWSFQVRSAAPVQFIAAATPAAGGTP